MITSRNSTDYHNKTRVCKMFTSYVHMIRSLTLHPTVPQQKRASLYTYRHQPVLHRGMDVQAIRAT